ncbi:MAG: hypothetical protein ACD_73C00790G0004 [uncultured bacterium]|nr:MAG: hypothetical protein ACD_73C00790G0004 [uncultured bacterium]
MAKRVDVIGLQLNGIAQQVYHIDTAKLSHRVTDLLPDFDQLRASADALAENFRTFKVEPLIQKIIASGKSLAGKHQLQWSRKIFHTLSGLFGLWLWAYSGLQESTVLIILGTYFTYAVSTEILRKVYPGYNRWMIKTCGHMMREHEKTRISSATYYLGSMFFVMVVFPKEVSILTLFFIAVGDTAAGIVGVLWGKHKLTKHASLEGTLACFTVCFLATVFFVSGAIPQFELHGSNIYLFSLIAGIIACVAESSIKKLDDNLVMPLLSAPALTLLLHFFK